MASARCTIEQCFEEAKDDVGLDHYEVRTWPSWHRYTTLGMMALAWLASVRAKLPAEGAFPYAPAMNPELVPTAARPGPAKNVEPMPKTALALSERKPAAPEPSEGPPTLAPWSIPEVRRLIDLVLPLPAHSPELRWTWSMWRRRKRAQARACCHLRRRSRPFARPRAPSPRL